MSNILLKIVVKKWIDAKKKFHLSDTHIQMEREGKEEAEETYQSNRTEVVNIIYLPLIFLLSITFLCADTLLDAEVPCRGNDKCRETRQFQRFGITTVKYPQQ